MAAEATTVTAALLALRQGEEAAFDRLVRLVYEDLKRIARQQRNRAGSHAALTTTALVHETYLRLVDQTQVSYKDRAHFLAAWALAMRHALVDEARRRSAQKRGGGRAPLPLDEGKLTAAEAPELVLAVDEALQSLGAQDRKLQEIVVCRFFAGLTEPETAEALGISLRSVQRGWWKARGWLGAELQAANG